MRKRTSLRPSNKKKQKLKHATDDVKSIGHKILDKDKEIAQLKEKLKDKNKIVKKEIDEEVEKYITTHGTEVQKPKEDETPEDKE